MILPRLIRHRNLQSSPHHDSVVPFRYYGSKLFNVTSSAGGKKSQCPNVHPRDRDIAVTHLMDGIEKSAIPSKRDDHFRTFPCSLNATLSNKLRALRFKHRLNFPRNQRIAYIP